MVKRIKDGENSKERERKKRKRGEEREGIAGKGK